MDISELFWNASLDELKRGYVETEHHYICLLCGKYFEKGIVYPEDGVIYESLRYVRVHTEKSHGSVFDYLRQLDKKLTGLTDHQKSLLGHFYEGRSDKEVQTALGTGSASTIRNHRFMLKEKERQAKLFLAIMELLKEKDRYAPSFISVHKNARMVDERFPAGGTGPLQAFPRKEKHKLVVLRELARRFDPARFYSEKEINNILQPAYGDYVTLRRYLIEYGFLDRKIDGSQYWLKP
jgi:hypothetical protein